MLIVVLKSMRILGNTKTQNSLELHVPFRNLPTLVGEEIDYIQADGDELLEIASTFEIGTLDPQLTIPMTNNRVVKWYGDIAKTIYFNLC